MFQIDVVHHIQTLWLSLAGLIILSSFFSFTETAFMSVNHYRLRHLARHGNLNAKRASLLLERPDKLLGLILFCDTFADILASAIATLLAVHYLGAIGVLVATVGVTFVILIFGELAPKTLAALHPMRITLYSAFPLWILLKILSPIIWLVNFLSNGFLYILGVRQHKKKLDSFTIDELRTVLTEAGRQIPGNYQRMLLQLLSLEKTSIEDVMIPRHEIVGIDVTEEWSDILAQLATCQHTRLPVYEEHIDNIVGILHVRDALNLLAKDELSKASLEDMLEAPYFVPEQTSLSQQLVEFSHQKTRMGLVVDEYGDIQGLIAIEDILEEVVGEFTTDTAASTQKDVLQEPNGNYILDGGVNLRVLNRNLHIHFPLDGPKTLSGLITEYLEMIPPANTCVRIAGYPLEILQIKDNMVKSVRLIQGEQNAQRN
ncbi:MAG TPA: HlyC/CorC family transporter [Gammaproteobacteria bacterium]|nr:HlyC/CorC family transporter [Gammaproteobacteria bacterium]